MSSKEILKTPPPEYTSRKQDSPSTFESSSDLIIGIDFGTTFTGVAYAHSTSAHNATTTTSDLRRIAEKVFVIKAWPNQTNMYSEKIPSVLAYNTKPPGWGASVRLKDEPRVAHFKLGLQEHLKRHYLTRSTANVSVLGGHLNDHNWRHPQLPEKTALDYTADYLTHVCDYVSDVILPSRYGPEFLENQQISYVITVPAIWSDKAKELTRKAAVRAGITRKNLLLVTEPEAAALYCATLCEQVDLKEGDRFLICDAGGGTVDLISYKVITQNPFKVEECSVGTGAACGSIYLNQGFEKLIRKRFGKKGDLILTERRVAELVGHFEASIKRQYNPLDPSCPNEFEIAVAGVPDMPEISLEDGYLTISKDDIQGIFDPIFNQILELIKGQMENIQKRYKEKLRTLFLVGGLGSNLYLSKFLDSELKGLIAVKQPETGYSAIMRGAVLYKLGLDFVKDRMMRLNYGVCVNVIFVAGNHPEYRKFTDLAGNVRCRDVMKWLVNKGDKVSSGTMLEHRLQCLHSESEYLGPNSLSWGTNLYVCDDDTPPKYNDTSTLKTQCQVRVDLRQLPKDAFKEEIGPKGKYYEVNYAIALAFGPGGIEFKFLHHGKVIGSVDCDYY